MTKLLIDTIIISRLSSKYELSYHIWKELLLIARNFHLEQWRSYTRAYQGASPDKFVCALPW